MKLRRVAFGSCEAEPSLFDYVDMALPIAKVDSAAALSQYPFRIYGHLRLLVVSFPGSLFTKDKPQQLSLPFMHLDSKNIVRFIPPKYQPYLDFSVYTAFRGVTELHKPALELERLGVRKIGDLIQLHEAEILQFPFMTQNILNMMKEHLARAKFGFGMSLPLWNKRNSGRNRTQRLTL